MTVETSAQTLGEVFIERRQQLKAVARKIVRSPDTAEEVVQDAWLRIAGATFDREIDKPYAYCCQVVRNIALDLCRRQTLEASHRVFVDDEDMPEEVSVLSPDQGIDERRLLVALDRALDALPARTRRAFEMYRLGGLTQREIGRELDCSATLVNFMVRDAMTALVSCRHLLGG